MKAWMPVIQRARRSLWALALVVLLSVAAVYGFSLLAAGLQQDVATQQSSLQAEQGTLAARQDDLSNVRTHISAYEKLRQQGLVGTAERAQWVEQLQASFQRLGLPDTLTVQLAAAKPLVSTDPAVEAAPTDPSAPPILPQVHDLQFELRNVHEQEVLALLQDFRANVKARFRVDGCHLREPGESGMTVTCTLRFVTIAASMASGPQTPASGAP